MSMLAEKKSRQKWCVNPRGKAWSDDQSKFGQKLLEKMGWSAGQGLGANNQGPTEIILVRMKDDNKGLGFKENGEEWLKTTSDFNELLDQLGSTSDDVSNEKADRTSSLEDRSKKSKARVHYHKFTRGKDLSRYSNKDLASIIGPNVVKPYSEDENKDYSSNQINKGSYVDYFNGKKPMNGTNSLQEQGAETEEKKDEEQFSKKVKKSKKDKEHLADQLVNNLEPSDADVQNKDKLNPESEYLLKHQRNKKTKSISEYESLVPTPEECADQDNIMLDTESEKRNSKPKKRKFDDLKYVDDNSLECTTNNPKRKKNKTEDNTITKCLDESVTVNQPEVIDYATGEKVKDKKKKRKNKCVILEITKEPDEQHDDSSKQDNTVIQENSKKQKIKCNDETDNATDKYDSSEKLQNHEGNIRKKKKRQRKEENNLSFELSEETTVFDPLIDNTSKKQKNKNLVQECESEMQNETENACSPERTSKKRKKRERSNNSDEIEKCNLDVEVTEEYKNNSSIDCDENLKVKKKKSKKAKRDMLENDQVNNDECQKTTVVDNGELTEDYKNDASVDCDVNIKVKKKKSKKAEQDESKNDQENRSELSDCIEVKGRKTRLKKLNAYDKPSNNIKYETEEFMSFSPQNNTELDPFNKIQTVENNQNVEVDEKTGDIIITVEKATDIDCNTSKRCVVYEHQLITAKFKELNMVAPKVIVVLKVVGSLNTAIKRKLIMLYRSRYYYTLLPKSYVEAIKKMLKEPKVITFKVEPSSNIIKPSPANNNSNIVVDDNTGRVKITAKPTEQDCEIAKRVIAYEYRQITGKFQQLKLSMPEVKVAISGGENLPIATRKKLKLLNKSRYLKTLLPKSKLTEIEASVKKVSDELQPKINMINTIEEIESKAIQIAKKYTTTSDREEDNINDATVAFPDKLDVLKKMSQQLQLLMDDSSKKQSTSGDSKEPIKNQDRNGNDENSHDTKETPLITNDFQKRLDDRLKGLAEQMKVLVEGKQPTNFSHSAAFRGRGRGRGNRRAHIRQTYKQYNNNHNYVSLNRKPVESENQNSSLEQLKAYTESLVSGRGRFTNFASTGRIGIGGRTRGFGRNEPKRGRISQNNHDAKEYAMVCKALDKVPEISFRGVDLKNISGYGAKFEGDINVFSVKPPKKTSKNQRLKANARCNIDKNKVKLT